MLALTCFETESTVIMLFDDDLEDDSPTTAAACLCFFLVVCSSSVDCFLLGQVSLSFTSCIKLRTRIYDQGEERFYC